MADREKINYEVRQDKIAEYKEQCYWARREYCERDCEEHGNPKIPTTVRCNYFDPEEEAYFVDECFRDKGW